MMDIKDYSKMPCLHPITITTKKGDNYNVPCRHCLNCRLSYQKSVEFALKNELYTAYQKGFGASFITFTYNDENLPENNSLKKSDFQNFMKSLRRQAEYHNYPVKEYKYLACGEYGDSFGRPHYHCILIGLTDYMASQCVKNIWKKGLVDVGTLKQGGIKYVLKYCLKNIGGRLADELYTKKGLEQPFILRSKNLGKTFMIQYFDEISSNGFRYVKNGTLVPIPKYYRNKYDIYKTFDNSYILKKLQNEAQKNYNSDINTYSKILAINIETELTNKYRQDGIAVDSTELSKLSYPDYTDSKKLALEALDL